MAQDYYDILQPFDHIKNLIDDNKALLGIRHIAENDDSLIPEYPSVLIQTDRTERIRHATRQFMVVFHIDLWIFHADMALSAGTRSRRDIELATKVRKLLHANMELGGHIIDSFVDGEFPGFSRRLVGTSQTILVTTRLTWQGQNRVPYEMS